ncbi:CPBP family intramembrane metalloprotease [Aquihabitans sp. G128]|uniref:CPBP family intramembrane glutamic endopeptidase n=1 Tax=Aquihabitans sp. G128 TaxID=2849779 RepID=UPI001C213B89|nr:CPBP family intramembrane glutamic endopeptidase [Aquihabitans sp. G128]QXC60603.1 CPBP family intramembrane metalloprotease [Aquihabitans sp. G128]
MSGALLGALILAGFGYSAEQAASGDIPLALVALQYPPLWVGFVGVPVWAAARKGRGWIEDFRVRIRFVDVLPAAVIGILLQLVVVPLVSWPFLKASGTSFDELGESARDLVSRADSNSGLALMVLLVVIGAPLAEELFFRGLLLRAFEKRFGTAWALAGSSLVFGITHFQLLQTPALTAAGLGFALLAVRSKRLGPAVVAHMAFNAVTVASLALAGP